MRTACLVWLGSLAVAAGAWLVNAGFESGDFRGWRLWGRNWRVSTWGRDSRRGIYGAVNDVHTNATSDEFRVLAQEVRVKPGQKYVAGAWLRAVCIESTESFLEVQFLDREGSVLAQYQGPRVTRDQDFRYYSISNMVAPEGARWASVRGVVHILGLPERDTDFLVFDDFSFRAQTE